jgi:histidyl-tRNA synthetase
LIYSTVFNNLQLPVEIHINNRKILQALAEKCGGTSHMMNITIAIDKLDKIGMDKVKQELRERGLNEEQVALVEKYISIKGDNQTSIQQLSTLLGDIDCVKEGINEMAEILQAVGQTMPSTKICVCPSLARGLNYYTGTIFEVKAVGVEMGSIGGGGRYDDLTGLLGVKGIAGVGISFGVDRIHDVLEELDAFPEHLLAGTTALIFNTGIDKSHLINVASLLRNHHISCEIFHEAVKFDKQFKYAEKKQIPFIIIIGDEELAKNTVTVKNLKTGKQDSFAPTSLPSMLSL